MDEGLMNENDLRDCFAMFKAVTGVSAEECYEFADEMLEVRKQPKDEEGIVAIKKRVRKVKE
jgi:hypothetical protein